jgi:hypothetical protein
MLAVIRLEVRMSAGLVRRVPSVFALPPSGWIKELVETGRWVLCVWKDNQRILYAGFRKITFRIVLGVGDRVHLIWPKKKNCDSVIEKGQLENCIKPTDFPPAAV